MIHGVFPHPNPSKDWLASPVAAGQGQAVGFAFSASTPTNGEGDQISVSLKKRPLVDAAFLADPCPTCRALRQTGPLHWSEEFFGGAWLLTRHVDIESVLRDPRHSAQRTGGWLNDVEAERGEVARCRCGSLRCCLASTRARVSNSCAGRMIWPPSSARHARPEQLDILRPDPGALAFGSGAHACLGAALTRVEAEVMSRQLLGRRPRMRLAQAKPRWMANPAYRGLQSLMLQTH